MQLAKIKMSGFKSFVDPTTINFPSKLVAVVGPNGCGKSNIIDAVTWVMGESSPKYLRGEALTDVIFNGSTSRKPVGQASVELVFDNSDNTLGGELSKFNEISVKRVINRESDSTYYLNGVRCRKKDVVSIFLGTGLGPRSYSIIGQNMISKIIEAKPEELRVYLEEAAGVSKYKDRRHETELRMQHTKENLARVNDLRGELEKQLNHLKHQANIAEKYKVLKQQERLFKAEWYAIQWRELDSKMVGNSLKIQSEETFLESRNSELSKIDREVEQLRHEQRVAQDAYQEVQRRYYAVGNEITRVEQDILHHQERQQQWESDFKQTENDWQTVKNQLSEAEDNLYQLEHDLQTIEPEFAMAGNEVTQYKEDLQKAEQIAQSLQSNWEEFSEKSSKTAQTAQVEKNNIEHLEQKIELLLKRQEQLKQEEGQIDFAELNSEVEEFSKQAYLVNDQLKTLQQQLEVIRTELINLNKEQQQAHSDLDKIRSDSQKLRGQQASLEALQQTALGQRDNSVTPWLQEHKLSNYSRLAQNIKVAKGWELAVEKVLGVCLQAICVEDLEEITPHVNDLKSGNLCVISAEKSPLRKNNRTQTSLLEKIESKFALDSLISGVYVADTVEEALTLCESLGANESIITRDGVWLNYSWIKVLRQSDPAAGVLQREEELKDLELRITDLDKSKAALEEKIKNLREKSQNLEASRDKTQQSLNAQQAQSAQLNAQHKMKQERLLQLKKQAEKIGKEQLDCSQQLEIAKGSLEKARYSWETALKDLEQFSKNKETMQAERESAKNNLHSLRSEVDAKQQRLHELEIRIQTVKSQKTNLQQNIVRMQSQISSLNERKIVLQSELASLQPMDNLKKTLSRALDKHVSVEVELNTARVGMESLDQEFQNLDESRQLIERDTHKIRNNLESLRVESQGWKVKTDTIIDQIKETEFKLEEILKDLPQDISAEDWQAKIQQVTNRINRLGPINLVAIDEYAICLERKEYLDKQVEDLQAGLNTLDEAISKIDKETRARFKETFDKVNARFQELFPTIFGGGKAYLELTSENYLEAGITMMACPPGKRNSSIYLLSGGEKSLTAIALIFSIFYLNPAPFCLLDEVDAPLDDANVLRYTRLVKTMAEKTQFIFISHNKLSIEMGEHLIGVTMNEPGVSRLVSVDIEKAISMAGSTTE